MFYSTKDSKESKRWKKDQIKQTIIYGIIKYYDDNKSLQELNDELNAKK